MSLSIIYLSDCTPLYRALGAPDRITNITTYPLNGAIRLVWDLPQNSSDVTIDSYLIRYKLSSAPLSQTIGEVFSFVSNAVISNLTNGVSYDFWVIAKNRFGESPFSPTVSITPGATPSPSQFIRRAYHSTTSGNGIGIDSTTSQKIGIEFTPPLSNNGATPLVFTIKYTRIGNIVGYDGSNSNDISFVITDSVQERQIPRDASNSLAIRTIGVKGNYIQKEIIPPSSSIITGNYRFEVFTNNMYGLSLGPDISFVIPIYSFNDANASGALIPRIIAPTFSSYSTPANAGIVSIVPSDSSFRFRWKQYRGAGNGSTGENAYNGWVYRIQYTDDKNYWYYLPSSSSTPETAKYPEYTIPYDLTSIGSDTDSFAMAHDIMSAILS